MYSEKSFKSYIFWIQVKRVVLIILLSIIGAALGVGIGQILKGTLGISSFNALIVIGCTVLFFLFSLLVTAGTGKSVQDGYWKIAVLRKLTVIEKDLETSNAKLTDLNALEKEASKERPKEKVKTIKPPEKV